VTFLAVVIAMIAPGSTLAVAASTPTMLGDAVFLVELPDNPTILGIVGVLLVNNAVTATSTFIAIGVVPAALLMIGLRREDSSSFHLGSLDFGLGGSASGRSCTKSLPSSALAQRLAISKSLMTEFNSSFTENFSLILTSEMPVENAEMTSSLEILGILFLI
jgi:hypothetical protein